MPSPEAARPRLSAVLLAAGAGRRLGLPKALLTLHGRWMLPSLVRALRDGGAEEVLVVMRAEEEDALRAHGLERSARLIVHPAPTRGRTSSIQCGLRELDEQTAALIHPCDVPLLSADAVATLVCHWQQHPRRDALAVRPVTPGGRGGHPLLLGRERVAEALALAESESLRSLVHRAPSERLDVRVHGDPGPFLDVDTPEQLQLLESLLPGSDQSGTDQR